LSAARAYIKLYDFVPVRRLASRLRIELQIGNAQLHAIFLATHYEFITNRHIRTFTMLIDDFRFGEREIGADLLKKKVEGEQHFLTSEEQAIVAEDCLGLVEFTEILGHRYPGKSSVTSGSPTATG
jgi:hypothetical protein